MENPDEPSLVRGIFGGYFGRSLLHSTELTRVLTTLTGRDRLL